MKRKQLVLGMGTGRSGTLSLATILNRQSNTCFSHELTRFVQADRLSSERRRTLLPWQVDKEAGAASIRTILNYPGFIIGDVSSFWLPYVEEFLNNGVDLRVICIERPRHEVVRSFMDKTDRPSGSKNHWMVHDGTLWRHDRVRDPCFPKYKASTKEEAIGMYWDEYHKRAERLVEDYPECVRLWPLSSLRTRSSIMDILRFAGIQGAHRTFVHRNRSRRSIPQLASLIRRRYR